MAICFNKVVENPAHYLFVKNSEMDYLVYTMFCICNPDLTCVRSADETAQMPKT